ncbi:MAG TPA: hypothetical protein VFQ93_01100 [Casimicrobiaceae bacterium]|nr:hypothetical protein [Casimicrobiaceae bacterium]
MIRSTTCRLGVAVALAALAVGANAQPATNAPGKAGSTAAASTHDASKAPSAMKKSTTAKSTRAKSAATKSQMGHGGMATHRAAANQGNRSNAMEANRGDSAYRAALRACVTGPASQRDSCLDDAISRYART